MVGTVRNLADEDSSRPRHTRRALLRFFALGAVGGALLGCSSSPSTSSAPTAAGSVGASAPTPGAATTAAPAQAAGGPPGTWDDLVAAAQKEGQVVISGPPDPGSDTQLPSLFKQQFGIDMQYLSGNSSQLASRIESERAAGQYTIDVSVSGVDTAYGTFLANGWLDPLKPALLMPEVVDPSVWRTGGPWFRDPSGATIMQVLNTVGPNLLTINTDIVTPDQIPNADALLDPQWKGRIGAYNPGVNGSGVAVASVIYLTKGADFATQLFKGQSVALTRDYSQLADWVAHGSYPICIGVGFAYVSGYLQGGLPLKGVDLPDIPAETGGAFGLVNLFNNAPHPNAARVFANWIGSKSALALYAQNEGQVPVRNDIDPTWLPASAVPQPGVQYFDTYDYTYATTQRTQIRDIYASMLS